MRKFWRRNTQSEESVVLMGKCDVFFQYKNQLISDLLTNKDIVEMISGKVYSEDIPDNLVYNNVFPFEYIPDTIQVGKTFVCCDVDIQKTISKTYLNPTIYIWVFTHKSLLRMPTGGVRTDMLCSKIESIVNGNRYYGIGELELSSVKRFSPVKDYQGRVMVFNAIDYNRPHPSKKSVPSVRCQSDGYN